jgi:hypothetical protein
MATHATHVKEESLVILILILAAVRWGEQDDGTVRRIARLNRLHATRMVAPAQCPFTS